MKTVQVRFTVKSGSEQAFINETRINVENSRREPGVLRFEFYRQKDRCNVFLLLEQYRSPADQINHRETTHFLRWRDRISALLEKPYAITELEDA